MAYISHALQTFKMGVDLNQLYNERMMVTLDSENTLDSDGSDDDKENVWSVISHCVL